MHSNNCLKEVKISFLSQWRPAWVKKDVTSLLCSFYRLPGRNHQFSTRNPSLLTHHLQSVGSPECIGRIVHSHHIVKEKIPSSKIWNPKQNQVIVHLFTPLRVFWLFLSLSFSLRRFFLRFLCLILNFPLLLKR